MTAIKCKECSKEFQPESFGELGSFCPYCATEVREELRNEQVSELSYDENGAYALCSKCSTDLKTVEKTHNLDGKTYCHPCIEEAGLVEFMDAEFRMEETVKYGIWQRLKRGVAMGFLIPAIVAIFVSVLVYLAMMALNAGGQLGGINGQAFMAVVITVFVASYIGVTVITIPFCFLSLFCRFEESVCVENGVLIHRESSWKKTCPLLQCQWAVSKSGLSRFVALPLGTPVILIKSPEEKAVVCGYTSKTFRLWRGYFELIELPKFKHTGLFRYCKNLMLSVEIGGAIGLGFGFVFRYFTGNPDWISALVFMGFLDGFLIHVSYKSWIQKTKVSLKKYFNSFLFVIYFFSVAALSVIFFAGIDVSIFIVLCSINTLLGFILVREIRRKAVKNAIETGSGFTEPSPTTSKEQVVQDEVAVDHR